LGDPPVLPLADALARHKHELATRLLASVAGWEKFATELESGNRDRDAFIRRELHAFVDYLRLYFQTGDETSKHRHVGEKLKYPCHPALTPVPRPGR
jgi:hypothetical protein